MGDGEQFQRGDTEVFQIGNHRRMAECLIGAAHRVGDRRVQPGQPFDMRFINHGVAPRRARRSIVFPVVEVVHHHAFGHDRRAVAVVGLTVADVKQRVVFKLAIDAVRARVNQQLRRVKPVPLSRLPRTVYAKTVMHPRTPTGQVPVPDIPCARR